MPVPPKPFKYICQNCGYSRVVVIKSDALTPIDVLNLRSKCPKCGIEMKQTALSSFDYFKMTLKNIFGK